MDLADTAAAPSQPVASGSYQVKADGPAAVVSTAVIGRLVSGGAESMRAPSGERPVTSPPAAAALPQPRSGQEPGRPIVVPEEKQRERPDVASAKTHRPEQRDGRAPDDPWAANSRPLAEITPVTARQPVPMGKQPPPDTPAKTFVPDHASMSSRIPVVPVRQREEMPIGKATEPAERRSDAARDHGVPATLGAEVPAVMAPGVERPAPPTDSPSPPLAPPTTSRPAAPLPEIVEHPRRQLQVALLAAQTGADGSRQVRLDLHPEILGSMHVHIVQAAGAPPRVMIAVSKADTLALLRGDVPALHAALDQAGIPAEGRSLSLSLVPAASGGSSLATPETIRLGTDGNADASPAPLSLTAGGDTPAGSGAGPGAGFGAGSGHQAPHHRSPAAVTSSYGQQASAGEEVPIPPTPPTPRHARAGNGLDITA